MCSKVAKSLSLREGLRVDEYVRVCVPSAIPPLLFLPSCHSNHHPCACVCLGNVKSKPRQAETALSTPQSHTLPLSSELCGDQTKLKTHVTHNPLLASMPDPTPTGLR